VDPDGEDWERTVRTVETVGPQRGGSRPRAEVLRSWPAEEDWKAEVAAAEAACRSGALEKVVLARCVEVATEARPEAVLDTLAGRYPTCTSFAVSAGQAVFVGATPETLVRVRGERVWTQALAGTAPRGLDPQQDGTIRRRLLESPKEAREHDLVVSHLRQALGAVCADVRCGRRGVLLLPNVQHLRTRLSGRIQAPAGLLELAGRLHPTPAVAGLPVAAATEWIRGHESVPRGWYAGLVGWVDAAGGGAVVVAIRSALVQEGHAWAFAGCGIVAGSDPQRELEESRLKLRPLMEALGVAGR
jgi:menaquinone-specific isochorismate synthase